MCRPLIENRIKINKENLFFGESLTQGVLEDYFNNLLKRLSEYISYEKIRTDFVKSLDEMSDISGKNNVQIGNTISYRDFIRLETEIPEANELFNPKVKGGSFDEIEGQFSAHGKKIIKFFKEQKDSELSPFVRSGAGVNTKQFTQCVGFIGLKPDMDGSVIPVLIEDNFLNGLTGLESYFINSKGTRKALKKLL